MKAIIYKRYGPPEVLKMVDLPKPVPADDEILIRIRATTVSAADWRARSLKMPPGFGPLGRLAFGIKAPRQPILGTELAGDIEAVGKEVTSFKVGDPVFAFAGEGMGCYVEYKCMPADGAVAIKPSNISYEQAAALSFGGSTMLDFFQKAALRSGERVLVNGASGAVGTAAVQLAKHFGAHVTGVCSTANLDLVRSIGADEVIDYTKRNFAKSRKRYDVIVDTVATASFARCSGSLSDGGRLILVLASLQDLILAPWHTKKSGKTIIADSADERPEYQHQLAELAATGRFSPVIDRCYPFEEMVEAHRYVDQGRKRGNVVITLAANKTTRRSIKKTPRHAAL